MASLDSCSNGLSWLPIPVLNPATGVEQDKWDTTGVISEVSHFNGRREELMTKVPSKSKQKQRELTEEELKRLAQFMDVLIEIDMKQKSLYRRLKQEPKGFAMSGEGRNCSLCGRHMYDTDGWFDK